MDLLLRQLLMRNKKQSTDWCDSFFFFAVCKWPLLRNCYEFCRKWDLNCLYEFDYLYQFKVYVRPVFIAYQHLKIHSQTAIIQLEQIIVMLWRWQEIGAALGNNFRMWLIIYSIILRCNLFFFTRELDFYIFFLTRTILLFIYCSSLKMYSVHALRRIQANYDMLITHQFFLFFCTALY